MTSIKEIKEAETKALWSIEKAKKDAEKSIEKAKNKAEKEKLKIIEAAQKNMASPTEKTYKPDKDNVRVYKKLYKLYKELGDVTEGILRKL